MLLQVRAGFAGEAVGHGIIGIYPWRLESRPPLLQGVLRCCAETRKPSARMVARVAVGDRAEAAGRDQPRVLRQHAARVARLGRVPGGAAARDPASSTLSCNRRLCASMVIESPSCTSAIVPPTYGLGRDVADHHAPGAAGEAAVGDQADRLAQPGR